MKKLFLLIAAASAMLLPQVGQAFSTEGFYLGGFGGVNFREHHHHDGFKDKYKPGYFTAAAVGYKWDCFRLETEFSYRRNSVHYHGSDDTTLSSKHHAHKGTKAALVNAYYDFDLDNCFCIKPYVGAGLGWAQSHKESFAWQLIGGVAYPLTECVDLAIEYRYFNTKVERNHNHDVAAGLRFWF